MQKKVNHSAYLHIKGTKLQRQASWQTQRITWTKSSNKASLKLKYKGYFPLVLLMQVTQRNIQNSQSRFLTFQQNMNRYLEECQENPELPKAAQSLPTIVVVALDNLGGLIQPVLIEFLLGQFVPEPRIQGAAEGGKLQLGGAGIAGIPAGSGHGFGC